MGDTKLPEPPNPWEQAMAQGQADTATAAYNAKLQRSQQITPTGGVKWVNNGTDANPEWVQTTYLSAPQQSLFDKLQTGQIDAAGRANMLSGNNYNRMILNQPTSNQIIDDQLARGVNNRDYGGSLRGQLSAPLNDYQSRYLQMSRTPVGGGGLQTRQHIEKSLMDRLNPQLRSDQNSLEAKLANQGLQPGTEAYNRAMDSMDRRTNDARLGVIGQATQEMGQSQAMDINRRGETMRELQAGQQADYGRREQYAQDANAMFNMDSGQIKERLSQAGILQGLEGNIRDRALSEISAYLQQAGNVNIPQYTAGGGQGIQSPDMAGMIENNYQSRVANTNARNESKNQKISTGVAVASILAKLL